MGNYATTYAYGQVEDQFEKELETGRSPDIRQYIDGQPDELRPALFLKLLRLEIQHWPLSFMIWVSQSQGVQGFGGCVNG